MKKFSFGMETVLDLRLRKEEEVKLQLATKLREIFEVQQDRNKVHDALKELQSTEKQQRAHADSVLKLRYSVAYRFKLKQDLLKVSRKIDDLNAEAVKIQRALIHATSEKRAIEIVKEKRLQEWQKEYRSREQDFIDDISQQAFIRKIQSDKEKL
jgi:flagellar FliJ protein